MQRVECGGVSVVDILELSRCPCGAGDLENGSPVGTWGEAEVHEEEHRLSPVVRSRGRVPQGRGGVLLLEYTVEVIIQEFELEKLRKRGYVIRFIERLDTEVFKIRVDYGKIGALTLLTAELLAEEFGVRAEVIDPAELFPEQRLLYWGERAGRDQYAEMVVVRVT